ncbi:MAG: ribonuclease III [Clostridia bacterium]|nr:ribonuclease III [Clostridia bacterium]
MFDEREVERKIGYVFHDKTLVKTALTHSSYTNLHGGENNERLEYLGDSVLQLIVTERQYAENGRASEGDMTKRRQELVREAALLAAVQEMGLAPHLLASGGEANVGKKTLASLYESVLAAVYLDGGYDAAKAFVDRHPLFGKSENYKGELQEFLQKDKKAPPRYEFAKDGPDDKPNFVCTAFGGGKEATGHGASKRAAEQQAAKALLAKLK